MLLKMLQPMTQAMLCMIALIFWICDESTSIGVRSEPESTFSAQKCWVFFHNQKCGGSTVKGILEKVWDKRYIKFLDGDWRKGDKEIERFESQGGLTWSVAVGDYVEAMRNTRYVNSTSARGAACDYFTLFRHPVEQLVSAYYFCHQLPQARLCGTEIVKAQEVDLVTFAQHWSNFGIRLLALRFVSVEEVFTYARTPEAMALLPESISDLSQVPAWYLAKLFFNRPQDNVAVEGQLPDAHLHGFLGQVQEEISNGYVAVGVLEEWDTTLALFDVALDMKPDMSWREAFENQGEKNAIKNVFDMEKRATLKKAWTDPELKKYIWLDLLLYEHAVDVFHQQVQFYGLS